MRHQVKNTRINRPAAQLKALLRSLATSLIMAESIKTTKTKAKVVSSFMDKLVARTKKKDKVNAIRYAMKFLFSKEASKKLVDELTVRYKDRTSGFTRVVKAGNRPGDNAPVAIIQFV